MTQYKRVGLDFTCDFTETPNPEFWEPVAESKPPVQAAAPAETEKSDA
jgi:hypothetical protein